MALRFPSEIVVERFLPTARSMLTSELSSRGFTQQEIASHLGVTQSAVSKYMSGEGGTEERFENDPRMEETVETIARRIDDDGIGGYEILSELLELVREFEDRGPICEVHEDEMPSLEGLGCDLCVRGSDEELLAERTALSSVRKGARKLANSPRVAEYVPNVGTNVVTALPDAEDETDVAAVPGRIYTMRGRINIPANPEFGASQHVARAVLAAKRVDTDVRGCVNLATSESLLESTEDGGLDIVEFDASYDSLQTDLFEVFREFDGVPDIAYHEGGFGVEPITYVFGETAVEAGELASSLVDV
ncbi:MAG: thiamine-phosphate synthase family protein [Halobacteria archaeon]|nr:thiamine-phosphate synthase family protein [Halobacteria archaeon]